MPVELPEDAPDAAWEMRERPQRPAVKPWQRPWNQGAGAQIETGTIMAPQILYSAGTAANTTYTDASAILGND